ncbi:hypothetical protein GCM10008955_17090 [Deinococcus malanensis]|uniref:Uncharacterized protein n=1 Tax=Deinococcus malanensis TaxID=1706855 RepID=A0ABQ2ETK4_9DEIO|nr:hypothetical protein [Deinococcus malanensis]GGK24077.1 hypothetical protein GCM10008955_17090 [Deinococcus malanensis]
MSETVRRSLLRLLSEDGQQQASVVVLVDGSVRLRIQSGEVSHDLHAATLEDLTLLAAMEPILGAELYHLLTWELDLLALRGAHSWDPTG